MSQQPEDMTDNTRVKTNNIAGKYLTFGLANEKYGLPVLKVKEILGMMPINTVPQSSKDICGVINLRDKIIPILDLRSRFNMTKAENTKKTCIIVVEAQKTNLTRCCDVKKCGKNDCPAYNHNDYRCWMVSGTHCRGEIQGSFHEKVVACRECDYYQSLQEQNAIFLIGIIVDEVHEVATFIDEQIEDASTMNSNLQIDYILGLAKHKKKVVLLLNIDNAMAYQAVEEASYIN